MDNYEGKRLNAPNDVVVKSDGSIWFTDPPFGLMSDYEGGRAPSEIGQNIYRIDGETLIRALTVCGKRPLPRSFMRDSIPY